MGKVLTDTASLTAVADAIREKSGGEEALVFPEGFVAAVAGITDGGNDGAQYVTNLYHMFDGATFPEGYELDLTVDRPGEMSSFMHRATGVKSVKLAFVNKGATVSANYVFGNLDSNTGIDVLETVDLANAECTFDAFAGAFQSRRALKSVIGEIDVSKSYTNTSAFYACTLLEEVRFKAGSITKAISFQQSPVLSDVSLQSIVNGLADLSEGTAQVLSLHTDVKAKLTEAQLGAITAKNWSVA